MDTSKRQRLIDTAKARGYVDMGSPRVLVTRQEFFDDNDDLGSIGCNLIEHPGVPAFEGAFRQIADMDGVAGVYFAITEIDEGYADIWPFTDTAYIVTVLKPSVFDSVLGPLHPDEVGPGDEAFANPPAIPSGFELIRVWWD